MATTVDDLTISYSEDGIETIKQLKKEVLTKGAWSTVMYAYQDWNAKTQSYSAVKYSIRRYQKRHGQYKQSSKFNISSIAQAKQIIEILQTWMAESESEPEPGSK